LVQKRKKWRATRDRYFLNPKFELFSENDRKERDFMATQTMNLTERMAHTQTTPLFYKIFALVSGGMFLDAIDVYMASAVSSYVLKTGWSTLALNTVFLSVGFLGLFMGSLLAGFIGDLQGRRRAYQVNLILFGGFTFLGAFAPNMQTLIACRLIASTGLGSEIVTGYSMLNEFAPIETRGKWCASASLIANCGAPITMFLCTLILPHFGWRPMFIGVGILAIILWILRRDIPESPRWLIAHGKKAEAAGIIEQLERDTPAETQAKPVAEKEVLVVPMWRSLLVAIVAVSATIICQYTFTTWVPTLLLKRGINVVHSLSFSTIMLLGAPVGAFIGTMLVDRIGRKKLIAPTFFLVAVFGILYGYQTTSTGVMIIGFFLTACFYVLMAAVVAVYVAELFPTVFRFRGSGIANATAKLLTVAMPYAVAAILTFAQPAMVFWGISAIGLFAAIVVAVFGPETRQRVIR
jgi:putative MFS transporter